MRERYVWSAVYGGCLMLQRMGGGKWLDHSSSEEGQYPKHDKRAKSAVKMMNAWAQARILNQKATDLERRAAILRQRSLDLCKKVNISGPEKVINSGPPHDAATATGMYDN